MRFQNLSPRLADLLRAAGHDAMHVRDLGLASAPDEVVMTAARTDLRTLISADTDFGTLLARTGATAPSFLLIRRAFGAARNRPGRPCLRQPRGSRRGPQRRRHRRARRTSTADPAPADQHWLTG